MAWVQYDTELFPTNGSKTKQNKPKPKKYSKTKELSKLIKYMKLKSNLHFLEGSYINKK